MTDQEVNSADDGVDFQLGQTETQDSGVDLGGESEFIPWDLEVQTAMKRLAIDIYESDSSGVAEPLTNSTAAVLQAVEEGHLKSPSDGAIRFSITESPIDPAITQASDYEGPSVERELTIRDNGMGMTEETVRRVLRFLGRSLTRDSGDRSGQFGMGFVAIFMLTGWSAALELHTHSRRDGEGPLSAVINNRGITIDHDGVLDDRMGADEYGTKLKLILKDDIAGTDIRNWVQNNAEYARVPVEYVECGENQTQTYQKTYDRKQLEDDYDEDAPVVVYEDEFIRAVTSPESTGQTLLLDVPIRRKAGFSSSFPWSLDIRLKNENRPIVESPDDSRVGLYLTEKADYESMSPERQAKYTSELRADEIAMPSVAGTRDTLKRAHDFWNIYVVSNLETEYEAWVRDALDVVSGLSDLSTLSRSDLLSLRPVVGSIIDSYLDNHYTKTLSDYSAARLMETLEDEYDASIAEDAASLLVALSSTGMQVSRSHDIDGHGAGSNGNPLWSYLKNTDGRVFMGVSLSQKRVDVVHADSTDNVVVKLQSADNYNILQQGLGWERLSRVTTSRLEDFDISDDLEAEFKNDSGPMTPSSAGGTDVNITYEPREYESSVERITETAGQIRTDFTQAASKPDRRPSYGHHPGCQPRLLVLFPDSAEENISDHYWMCSEDFATARTSESVTAYLTEAPNIVRFSEYTQQATQQGFETTSQGPIDSVASVDTPVFHYMDQDGYDLLTEPDILSDVPQTLITHLRDDFVSTVLLSDSGTEEFTYIPITDTELVHVWYLVRTTDAVLLSERRQISTDVSFVKTPSAARLYAHAVFSDIDAVPADIEEFFGDETKVVIDSVGIAAVDAIAEQFKN
jgi:hypothetical protein